MWAENGPIVLWMTIERLYLDVQLGRDLDKAAEECFEFLPRLPSPFGRGAGRNLRSPVGRVAGGEGDVIQQRLDLLLQHRCLVTLMNLASRKSAKPGLADRVLAYLEAGEKAEPENSRWKALQYEFLVALDRPKDLAKKLATWIAADDADNGWRLILGYLDAEAGQVPAAIQLFEAVRAVDELGPAEYRTLADWYMAVNRREDYDRARVETFKVIDEWQLNHWLNARLRPWQQY